jgi:hypothetical protein
VIRRNVLIFHSGGLGDFVLTWPLGLALGRLYPQSRIIYITQASKGALAAEALGLDWRDMENTWPALYSGQPGLSDAARTMLEQAHSVYSFMAPKGDSFWSHVERINPECAMIPLRVAPPPDFTGHALNYLVDQLSDYPAVAGAVSQICSSMTNHGLGRRGAGSTVLIHPGSGSREKCCPVDFFVQLSRRFKEVNILLGEVELERFSAAEIGQLEAAGKVVKPATYLDLYAALSAGGGFIGHDSGPTHLAAMMGLPTVSIFGPSDERIWRPVGPAVGVVKSHDLSHLNVDDVFLAFSRVAPALC